MKKIIYSILSVLFIVMLAACGSSNPWVGEWVPENDRNSCQVMHILDNGKAEMINDSSDGYAKMEGTWSLQGENEDSMVVKFDSNSIELDFENPIIEAVMEQGLGLLAEQTIEFGMTEDKDGLIMLPGNTIAFVRR